MIDDGQQRYLWDLHIILAMDLAAVVAQPLIDDFTGQPAWFEHIHEIIDRVFVLLASAPRRLDPGLSAALDGLQHLLSTLRDCPASEWTPSDYLSLLTATQTCAGHTARVGGFVNLWPYHGHPSH